MALPSNNTPWSKRSKEYKRAFKVIHNGRKLRALDYIAEQAKKMPLMRNSNDRDADGEMRPVNHEKNMRMVFMDKGLDALNHYIQDIARIFNEQVGMLNATAPQPEKPAEVKEAQADEKTEA